MVQSIELLLDAGSTERVRATWTALLEADLPSLAGNPHPSNQPHVTVAVAEQGLEAAVDAARAVFAGWDLGGAGLAAVLGAPLLFGGHRGRWVLARQVVVSRALSAMHSAVHHAVVQAAPRVECAALTAPDAWSPHVTLARRIEAARLPEALGLLDVEPMPVRIAGARFWDSGPKTITPLT